MNKLKIKLLTGRSGSDGSNIPGDKIDVPIREAIALIQTDQAEPTNKKAYEAALKSIEEERELEAEKEAEVNAVVKKETLALELRELYRQVALKVAEIEGIIFSDEEIESFIEEKLNGKPVIVRNPADIIIPEEGKK